MTAPASPDEGTTKPVEVKKNPLLEIYERPEQHETFDRIVPLLLDITMPNIPLVVDGVNSVALLALRAVTFEDWMRVSVAARRAWPLAMKAAAVIGYGDDGVLEVLEENLLRVCALAQAFAEKLAVEKIAREEELAARPWRPKPRAIGADSPTVPAAEAAQSAPASPAPSAPPAQGTDTPAPSTETGAKEDAGTAASGDQKSEAAKPLPQAQAAESRTPTTPNQKRSAPPPSKQGT